ncbi:type I polyketide synthase [Nostoc sp. UHCC 0302]|uniref:type I polyketide synthase n=1 Tax=Nostoc sp. UHCC 0302 TaxID=3134896 RepID=UPI00311C91DA
MILEQETISEIAETVQSAKIAIVGMDAFFGECNGLDAFERSVYNAKQHFIPLPPQRWHGIEAQENLLKKYGLTDGKPPVGAYITDFEIDTLAYKIPPNELEKLNPQQLLLLKVCDRALKDANMKQGGNVAVIIAAEAELAVHQLQQRWNLSWQIQDGLKAAEIGLSGEKVTQLETIVKDSVHHQVDVAEYLSYIGNIMASRISALWNFTGPAFTITAVETSAFKALEVAQMLLTTGEVDAVVIGAVDLAGGVENVLLRSQFAKINTGIHTLSYDQKVNGWMVGEGAGAIVLKRHEITRQNNERIYAVIDAISFGQSYSNSIDAETINQTCNQAFQMAGVQPTEVNYLEVSGSGIPQEDEAEITGLLQAYPGGTNDLNCALGSVKANIGHTYVASGIASLIKTALCLYYRYIPATPNWSSIKTPEVWQASPFYVPTESRPWFLNKDGTRRVAAINGIGCDGTSAHLILSEESNQQERSSTYLEQIPFYLFPLAANASTDLLKALENLQLTIENSDSLLVTTSQTLASFEKVSAAKYAIAIIGRNKKELLKEIESARKGVNKAFEDGTDWLTPLGSYFTAKPLGKTGEIAFVYPAAVNSYIGIGRNLFRLFPKLHDDVIIKSLYKRAADVVKLVFPRSLNKFSTKQLETLEKQLLDDSLVMFETEMICARIITTIVQDYFRIQPKYVFGYSLGETSMMVAQGIWSNFHQGSNAFNSSPLFKDRLSGSKSAVLEYWGLPKTSASINDNFWITYVLMANLSQVRECIKHEQRVYLTQINTPEEVLIAGEPAACERVIKTLGCNAFPAPFDHVIHCEAMQSEYEELVKLHSLPSQNSPDTVFYSAGNYLPITLDSSEIARSVSKGLCQQLDFSRLVNRVYDDGARIFIEAGAGSVCSRWIDKNLENKEHITVSLNRRGVDDHTSIIKALAKLVSHRVSLDLSPLYSVAQEISNQNKSTIKTVNLGRKSIIDNILSTENRKIFQDSVGDLRGDRSNNKYENIANVPEIKIIDFLNNPDQNEQPKINFYNQPQENTMKNIVDSNEVKEQLQSSESDATQQQISQSISYPVTIPQSLVNPVISPNLLKTQCQRLSANNSSITKAHANLLEARQESNKQISQIIQLQLTYIQHLLNQ